MSANNNRPGFFRRFMRAFFIVILLIVVIAFVGAVGAGAYFGYTEFQQISSQMAVMEIRNDSSVNLLRTDVDTLMETSSTQREVDRLNETIADLEAEIELLQTDLSSDIDQQQEVLQLLTDNVTASDSEVATLQTNLSTLSEALVAIQGDIIDNGSQIDALGGEIDTVQTAVTDLGTEMIAMEEEAMAMIEELDTPDTLQETLALFRVWELITRARLRLVEDNIGLATDDIESAVQTIEGLLALEVLATDPEKLEMVQARLALAFVNLPDRPSLAAADLESAWDELDQIFTNDILTDVSFDLDVETEDTAVTDETTEETVKDDEATSDETATEEEATPTPEPTTSP